MSRYTDARVQGASYRMNFFRNRKTLLHMLREVIHGQYRMSWLTISITVAGLAYVVFPFDLIPDYIPIAGWVDDGVAVYLVVKRLMKETQRYNRFKAMERKTVK